MPPGQPRQASGETCRYLGDKGCRIPRSLRPWICTWYICAFQKKYLADHPEISGSQLQAVIERIGRLRKQVEALFIEAVA